MFFSLGIYVLLLLLSDDEVIGNNEYLTEFSDAMCTNEYPVSHNRTRPDLKYYIDYDKANATAKTCHDFCNKDTNCRSVLYQKNNFGRRYCQTYNISVQELKDTHRSNEIFTNNDTAQWLIFITYDRDCGKLTSIASPTTATTPTTSTTTTTTTPTTSIITLTTTTTITPNSTTTTSTTTTTISYATTTSTPTDTSSIPSTSTTQASHNNTSRPSTKPANIFCPAGESLYGNVCKPCKENEVSAYGIYPCIGAGEGEKPNHDKSKFICIAGYERNRTYDKCQKCQAGYFKSESGDTPPCFPCPPNTEATKQGSTRCEEVIEMIVYIGAVIGAVVMLTLIVTACFLYWRKHVERCKQSPLTSNENEYDNGDVGNNIGDYDDEYNYDDGNGCVDGNENGNGN